MQDSNSPHLESPVAGTEVSELTTDPEVPTLAVRLQSPMSRGGQLGGSLALGLFMGLVVVGLIWGASKEEDFGWALLVAAAVIGLLPVLLLWSAFRQAIALVVPTTIVEVSEEPLRPGQTVQFCIKQPGPLTLSSLRANLIGLQRTERKIHRPDEIGNVSTPDKMLLHENILDDRSGRIRAGQTRQWIISFTVPGSLEPTSNQKSRTTAWKIEVWGRASFGLIGFMHQFPVKVSLPE